MILCIDPNDFYKQNFLNAKMVTNSNLSYYLNKKITKIDSCCYC